jgi:hypothetical protein
MKKERSEAGNRAVSNKNAGRKYQRRIAKRFGGKSVGTIEGQDIEHPVFSMECKKMKTFPSWFIGKNKNGKETGLWAQTLRNCPEGKIPLALLHMTGQKHEEDIVLMRLGDFENIVKPKESYSGRKNDTKLQPTNSEPQKRKVRKKKK